MDWKQSLLEGIKEGGRFLVSGITGWLLTEGVINTFVELVFGKTLSPEVRSILTVGFGYAIRSFDSFVHQWDGTKRNGIIPF